MKHRPAGNVLPVLVTPVITDKGKRSLFVLNVASVCSIQLLMNLLANVIIRDEQKKICSTTRASLSPVSAFIWYFSLIATRKSADTRNPYRASTSWALDKDTPLLTRL